VTQPYEIVEHSYDVVMSAPAAPDHAVRCGPAFFQSLTNGPQFAGILVQASRPLRRCIVIPVRCDRRAIHLQWLFRRGPPPRDYGATFLYVRREEDDCKTRLSEPDLASPLDSTNADERRAGMVLIASIRSIALASAAPAKAAI
jgi:hypothetical protein